MKIVLRFPRYLTFLLKKNISDLEIFFGRDHLNVLLTVTDRNLSFH